MINARSAHLEDKYAKNAKKTLIIMLLTKFVTSIVPKVKILILTKLFIGTLEKTIDDINLCLECSDYIPNCLICTDIDTCTKCSSSLLLKSDRSECLATCCAEEGAYPDYNTPAQCLQCSLVIDYCLECLSATKCVLCSDDKFLSSDKNSCNDDCSTSLSTF